MLTKSIRFLGRHLTLSCDGKCSKAWGKTNRPKVRLSKSPEDYEYLADHELPDAPEDPGTYHGGDSKPTEDEGPARQNKWCIQECERCALTKHQEEIQLPDFSTRVVNIPKPTPQTKAARAAWSERPR